MNLETCFNHVFSSTFVYSWDSWRHPAQSEPVHAPRQSSTHQEYLSYFSRFCFSCRRNSTLPLKDEKKEEQHIWSVIFQQSAGILLYVVKRRGDRLLLMCAEQQQQLRISCRQKDHIGLTQWTSHHAYQNIQEQNIQRISGQDLAELDWK